MSGFFITEKRKASCCGSRCYLKILALAAAGLSVLCNPAIAQNSSVIEEIVVTARKQPEMLQEIASSVSAYSSHLLRINGINGIEEVAQQSPGFVWTETGAANPHLFIRGIGTEGPATYAGGDPAVVVMVDGVYIGRISGTPADLFDLHRVEVLRGPQGTIYGKNATGGVVNLVTNQPEFTRSGQLSLTAGNLDRVNVRAHLTGDISDSWAGRLSFSSISRDGFIANRETGNDLSDENRESIRASLRYKPNERLDARLSIDASRERETGAPRDIVEDGTFNGGIHAITDPGPRAINAPVDPFIDRDIRGLTLQADYQLPLGLLTSVTAYRETDADWQHPFFGNPVTSTTIESTSINEEVYEQLSEELRLSFARDDGRISGLVGIFAFRADIDRLVTLNQQFSAFLPFLGGIAHYDQRIETRSLAIFSEADFKLGNDLTLTIGGRYSVEKKKQEHSGTVLLGPSPPPLSPLNQFKDLQTDDRWTAFTPKISVAWKPSSEVMIYGMAAKGFKSGGYQGIPPDVHAAMTPFDPEYIWNYELGLKMFSSNQRFKLNAAVFHMDYEDLQVAELIAGERIVIGNAAEAESKGLELEFELKVSSRLQLTGSYSYLDARFTEFASGATDDNSGNRLPMAPRHKVFLGLDVGLLTLPQ
ncbi:MAG: TonB-dependent receptor, partial [Gammaproteobacteria bacterium]|nr:TonB-dependent receptor [Gammaproteobacteria bacterium]